MYTYTFQADLNGEFISIPEELRHKRRKATFIVVMDDTDADVAPKKFTADPFIPTKGFKFNREDANER